MGVSEKWIKAAIKEKLFSQQKTIRIRSILEELCFSAEDLSLNKNQLKKAWSITWADFKQKESCNTNFKNTNIIRPNQINKKLTPTVLIIGLIVVAAIILLLLFILWTMLIKRKKRIKLRIKSN